MPDQKGPAKILAIEPGYDGLIDAKQLRRMSKILRMGTATALMALRNAAIHEPDAIITGTGLGCLADTGQFLSKMVLHDEELMNPTAFIQSTHNTISTQIGLVLKSHVYNNTFSHGNISFECALKDAELLLSGNEAENVLVGAADELTDISHDLQLKLGTYSESRIAGEGAAFFVLSRNQDKGARSKITLCEILHRDQLRDPVNTLNSILTEDYDIDIVLHSDPLSAPGLFNQAGLNANIICYTDLCGHYLSSSAFATWLATELIESLTCRQISGINTEVKKVLVYNNNGSVHHSCTVISAC